jgi:hypothetical protein
MTTLNNVTATMINDDTPWYKTKRHNHAPIAIPAPAPAAIPFYAPTLFLPEWIKDGKADLAYLGGDYIAFPHAAQNGKADVGEVDKVSLYFDVRVYKELEILWDIAAKTTGEIAWYMLAHRLNPMSKHWLAWGWFLPDQEATAAEVTVDGTDQARYLNWLNTEYEHKHVFGGNVFAHLTPCHKHPIDNWSATDLKQQNSREDGDGFRADHNIWYVQTPKGPRADLVVYEPILAREENIRIGLYVPRGVDAEVPHKRQKAIKAMVEALVHKRTYTYAPVACCDLQVVFACLPGQPAIPQRELGGSGQVRRNVRAVRQPADPPAPIGNPLPGAGLGHPEASHRDPDLSRRRPADHGVYPVFHGQPQ